MKTISRYLTGFLALTAVLSTTLQGCSSDDGMESPLVRETDEVDFSGNLESSKSITLRCNGAWHSVIPEGAEWVSVSPSEGVGDGSFSWIDIIAANNRGDQREATIFLECDGKRFPITVSQGEGFIRYSDFTVYGVIKEGVESDAQISVKYSRSFGDETIDVRGEIRGDVTGIDVVPAKVDLDKGEGRFTVNVIGTPSGAGEIAITLYINNIEVGTITHTVLKADEIPVEDFPVQWNFMPTKGTAADRDALRALHPEWVGDEHYCTSDIGNGTISVIEAEGKTAASLSLWNFNDGHLYLKGLYLDDYFLFTVPVSRLAAGQQINFKGSIGGSGSAAAFYMIEYSVDGVSWHQADGAQSGTFNNKTFDYHLRAVDGTTTIGDKTGNFSNTFTVNHPINNGTLFIRFRVCANVRVTLDNTITNKGGGSSRLKGTITISLVE